MLCHDVYVRSFRGSVRVYFALAGLPKAVVMPKNEDDAWRKDQETTGDVESFPLCSTIQEQIIRSCDLCNRESAKS